ncbi:MAG TPA: response regulator [Chitinophagaceae bacterium]|nr:response regulator [Chitinophagaceae bacterium]
MRNLLILDDNEDLLFAMQRLLSFYDFTVITTKDHKTFFEIFESSKPGIVIIDVLLSGADGRQICKKLREDPLNKEVTLILFSASSRHLENFEDYGADGIIEKPFGIKDIIEKTDAAVRSRKESANRR